MFGSMTVTAAVAALAIETAAAGAIQAGSPGAAPASNSGDRVCKYVVAEERGSKPYRLCLTKSGWAAKAEKDAKDANRIECRYEEVPGSKFRSKKICQPASEWVEQRRLHRQQVEDMQMRVCVAGAGC